MILFPLVSYLDSDDKISILNTVKSVDFIKRKKYFIFEKINQF